ncbi:F-box only protein 36 isoform X2 [Castor canadensis]|uniref:F-box only protein 36 isoform X2 n=1 Tax=Castor canadensis TaxID=51338 RepID=A0AC58MF65_CASCN
MASWLPETLFEIVRQGQAPSKNYYQLLVTRSQSEEGRPPDDPGARTPEWSSEPALSCPWNVEHLPGERPRWPRRQVSTAPPRTGLGLLYLRDSPSCRRIQSGTHCHYRVTPTAPLALARDAARMPPAVP